MTSKRTVLSRPRTRLYESNYNIGESYYRPALERLDRKYSGRPLTPPRQINPFPDEISERHARIFADEDLGTSRKRAEKHIKEDNLFDYRGARVSGRAAFLADKLESDFDDETVSAARRLRANKRISKIDDVDLESTSNAITTHRLLDRSEKILDSVGINDRSSRRLLEDDVDNRRAVRVRFDAETSRDPEDLCKWTPLAPREDKVSRTSIRARREEVVSAATAVVADSSAALRAKQSKDRLNDLEEEMAAMAEKQAAREAKVARLKRLIAETEAETADIEAAQLKAERASARKERLAIE